jgi:hypothetical protein
MNPIEQSYIWNRPSPVYNPKNQFPGQQYGGTIDQVRNLIQHQKKIKGFTLANANGFNSHNLQISGDARLLLGFAINSNQEGDVMTLKINNEIALDNVPVSAYSTINKTIGGDYYVCPRPLSGQDEIILEYTAIGAVTRQFMMVYL